MTGWFYCRRDQSFALEDAGVVRTVLRTEDGRWWWCVMDGADDGEGMAAGYSGRWESAMDEALRAPLAFAPGGSP